MKEIEFAVREGKKKIRYDPASSLADGGSATIYIGYDEDNNKYVLKKFKAERDQDETVVVTNLQEAEHEFAVSQRCPHLQSTGYNYEEDHSPILLFPYFEGQELQQFLENNPDLLIEERIALNSAIATAYQMQIVNAGVVHNDIQATNILIARAPSGEFIVNFIDLTRARLYNDHSHNTKSIILGGGTPEYMSPEMVEDNHNVMQLKASDDPLTAAMPSDIFALGKVYEQVLCGKNILEIQKEAKNALITEWRSSPQDVTKAPKNGLFFTQTEVSIKVSQIQAEVINNTGTAPEIVTLLTRCRDEDPEQRPSSKEIERQFSQATESQATAIITQLIGNDLKLQEPLQNFHQHVEAIKAPFSMLLRAIQAQSVSTSLSSNAIPVADKALELRNVLKKISELERNFLVENSPRFSDATTMESLTAEFKQECDTLIQQNISLATLRDVVNEQYKNLQRQPDKQEQNGKLKATLSQKYACLSSYYRKPSADKPLSKQEVELNEKINHCMSELLLAEKMLWEDIAKDGSDKNIQAQEQTIQLVFQQAVSKYLPSNIKADIAYTQCAQNMQANNVAIVRELKEKINNMKASLLDYQAWLDDPKKLRANELSKNAVVVALTKIDESERVFWERIQKAGNNLGQLSEYKNIFANGCEDAINALPSIQTSFLSASAKIHKKALAALKAQLEDFKQPSSVSAPSSSSNL